MKKHRFIDFDHSRPESKKAKIVKNSEKSSKNGKKEPNLTPILRSKLVVFGGFWGFLGDFGGFWGFWGVLGRF